MKELTLNTPSEGFILLDGILNDFLKEEGAKNGVLTVFCPHTTAGVTINENGDPDVKRDLLYGLGEISPKRREYRHFEGNSDAHLKSSLIGPSLQLIYRKGRILLGTWQSVYFCEFDGPRTRKLWLENLEKEERK